jgi:hypothetical protein
MKSLSIAFSDRKIRSATASGRRTFSPPKTLPIVNEFQLRQELLPTDRYIESFDYFMLELTIAGITPLRFGFGLSAASSSSIIFAPTRVSLSSARRKTEWRIGRSSCGFESEPFNLTLIRCLLAIQHNVPADHPSLDLQLRKIA